MRDGVPVPGQVPAHLARMLAENAEVRAGRAPPPGTDARVPDDVVAGFNLPGEMLRQVSDFVRRLRPTNEATASSSTHEYLKRLPLTPAQLERMLARAMSYYRHTGCFSPERYEHMAIVPKADDLEKGEPRGGKYHARVPTPDGHRYYYDPDSYSRREDAHVRGEEVLRQKCAKEVLALVQSEPGIMFLKLTDRLSAKYGEEMAGQCARQLARDGKVSIDPKTDEVRPTMEKAMGADVVYVIDPMEKSGDKPAGSHEGEGSRGGHIIGHTSSGKPIYAAHNHESHASFTADDHEDAALAHHKREVEATNKWLDRSKSTGQRDKAHAEMADAQKQRYEHWNAKVKSEGAGPESGSPIGKTSSGKSVYGDPSHSAHSTFTANEHRQAARLHQSAGNQAGVDAHLEAAGKAQDKEIAGLDKKRAEEHAAAQKHLAARAAEQADKPKPPHIAAAADAAKKELAPEFKEHTAEERQAIRDAAHMERRKAAEEGRGGESIGKTASGKHIYAVKDPGPQGGSVERRAAWGRAAAEAHAHYGAGVNASEVFASSAKDHREAYDHLWEKYQEASSGSQEHVDANAEKAQMYAKQATAHDEAHRRVTGESASDAIVRERRAKERSAMEQVKVGVRAEMGEKKIGETKSGKPIMGDFGHDGHKAFTSEDHYAAASAHEELAKKTSDAMRRRNEYGSREQQSDAQDRADAARNNFHSEQAKQHSQKAKDLAPGELAASVKEGRAKRRNAKKEFKTTVQTDDPKRVKLANIDGVQEVDAHHTSGNYSVHGSQGAWTVTHRPTGLRMHSAKSQKEAVAMAKHLHTHAPNALEKVGFGQGSAASAPEHKADVETIKGALAKFQKSLKSDPLVGLEAWMSKFAPASATFQKAFGDPPDPDEEDDEEDEDEEEESTMTKSTKDPMAGLEQWILKKGSPAPTGKAPPSLGEDPPQEMPTGAPGLSASKDANGGDLDGLGKPAGSPPTPPGNPAPVGEVPASKTEDLEAKVTGADKMEKGVDPVLYYPEARNEEEARFAHALHVRRQLQPEQDLYFGPPLQKSEAATPHHAPGEFVLNGVTYDALSADQATVALMKGQGQRLGSPYGPVGHLSTCPACGSQHTAVLTACPACGAGASASGAPAAMRKAQPTDKPVETPRVQARLQPVGEADEYYPGGLPIR